MASIASPLKNTFHFIFIMASSMKCWARMTFDERKAEWLKAKEHVPQWLLQNWKSGGSVTSFVDDDGVVHGASEASRRLWKRKRDAKRFLKSLEHQ
jgi:hypothetical protein